MTIKEYCEFNNVKSEDELTNHFRNNMLNGYGPVAFYSCLVCNEIIDDVTVSHKCKNKEVII